MGLSQSSETAAVEEQQSTMQARSDMAIEPQSLQPRKLRKPKVTILIEILREKAKLDQDLVTENNRILKNFLASFVEEMKKCDNTFEQIYNRIVFTGSFYSDLRVSKPDEFDLNIVLSLPVRKENISIQYHSQVPSYVKYKLLDEKIVQINYPKLSKFFKDGYLIPEVVRKWLQSVVDKALITYRCPSECVQIKRTASGPARTLILVKRNHSQIDIDLVPVIEFSTENKPAGIHGQVYNKVKNNNKLEGFLVPKPYQPNRQAPVNEAERKRLWRVHYPVAEANLIHDYGCVKSVIKLLKLLRDKENWKILASYYLKTIVMWMVFENPDKQYWTEDKLGERFMEALKKLENCIKTKNISYFFSSKHNLIDKISEAQAQNLCGRLRSIINEIERNYWNLWRVFGCTQTFDYDF